MFPRAGDRQWLFANVKIDMICNLKNQQGVASLIIVVVIVSILAGIAFVITQLSINELVIDFGADRSARLLQIADTCAEEAYYRLKLDSSYTGSSYSLGDGSCTVVVAGAGSTRTITVSATVDEFTRDFVSDVSLTSNLAGNSAGTDLTDWEESF